MIIFKYLDRMISAAAQILFRLLNLSTSMIIHYINISYDQR